MKRYLMPVMMAVACCTSLMVPAQSGSKDLILKNVEHDKVQTPQYSVRVSGSSKSDGKMNWLVLAAEYQTAPRWLDEVTVTYSVMLEGDLTDLPEAAKTPFTMFRGSVSYINVAKGRYESNMFLDPYTFARYGDVKAVHVSVTLNGEEVAQFAEPRSLATSEWWKKQTPNAIPLLNRTETPWRFIEVEAHGTIKP